MNSNQKPPKEKKGLGKGWQVGIIIKKGGKGG